MSNMSYCRFRNTLADLSECVDDLERRITGEGVDEDGDPMEPLSADEERAAVQLIDKCRDLCQMVLEESGQNDLNDVDLDAVIEDVQTNCTKAMAIRAATVEGDAPRVGDYIIIDGTPRRVIRIEAVGDDIEPGAGFDLSFHLADGGVVGESDFDPEDIRLESEVGVIR